MSGVLINQESKHMSKDKVDHEYPKWKYHATEAPKLVADKAEEDALGKGWHESPGEAEKPAKSDKK